MIDAHCHLYEVPEESWAGNGLEAMICCGSDFENSSKSIEIAIRNKNVYVAVGQHPEAGLVFDERIKTLVNRPGVIAIGECGMDTDREEEVSLFKLNIELAKETGLPLVVHCRNQFKKVFEVLDLDQVQMHCFTGTQEEMEECVRRGWYISFGGILTFKKSEYLREVAKLVPEDRLLIETDSPYLAPEPVRGQKNTPGNVKYVAEALAAVRGTSVLEIDKMTTENARRLFGL